VKEVEKNIPENCYVSIEFKDLDENELRQFQFNENEKIMKFEPSVNIPKLWIVWNVQNRFELKLSAVNRKVELI
jgi:hypothetical protein